MELLNKNKGITLISLIITIIILLILVTTTSVNIGNYKDKKEKVDFQNDMQRLEEGITQYYAREKKLPIRNKYTNTAMLEDIKNKNDNENYYIIDIDKIVKELNFGKAYNDIKDIIPVETNIPKDSNKKINFLDIYIINEKSHSIYYPKGVKYGDKIRYTIYEYTNEPKIEDVQITTNIELEKEEFTIDEKINIKVKQEAVDISKCKWVLNKINEEIGTNENDYTGGIFSKMQETLEIEVSEDSTYYLHILSVNKEGTKKETISEPIIVIK